MKSATPSGLTRDASCSGDEALALIDRALVAALVTALLRELQANIDGTEFLP